METVSRRSSMLSTLMDKELSFGPKVLGAGGSLLSGIGSYIEATGKADSYERSAKAVMERARWQETRLRQTEKETLGSLAFMMARAGMEMSGTAKDIQVFTEKQVDLDSQQIYENARAEYKSLKKAAKSSRTAGYINLAGSLL